MAAMSDNDDELRNFDSRGGHRRQVKIDEPNEPNENK